MKGLRNEVAQESRRDKETMPLNNWKKVAEYLCEGEDYLTRKIVYIQTNAPDPVEHPVISALLKAYVIRLQIHLDSIRNGEEGLKAEFRNHPKLSEELREIETWILNKPAAKRRPTDEEIEERIGDPLLTSGLSSSEIRQSVNYVRQLVVGRGAPNKRQDTLRLMDARVANQWSYKQLALQMCDCGLPSHTEHCNERIRKRIKELEDFLSRYNIEYRRITP